MEAAAHMIPQKASNWFAKSCSKHCIVAALSLVIYAILAACIFIEYPANIYADSVPRMYYIYISLLLKIMCVVYYAYGINPFATVMALFILDLVTGLLYINIMFLGVNSAACDNPVFTIVFYSALLIIIIALIPKKSFAMDILAIFVTTPAFVICQIYIVFTYVWRILDGVNYYLHPGDVSVIFSCVLSLVVYINRRTNYGYDKRIIGVYACILSILLAAYLSAVSYRFI
jgi:hypothetical protein